MTRVLVTNSNFLIPITLQHGGVNMFYFKLGLYNLTEFPRSTTSGCKDKGLQIGVCGVNSVPFSWCYHLVLLI